MHAAAVIDGLGLLAGARSVSKPDSIHVHEIASLQEVAWRHALPLLSSRLGEATEKLPLEI